MSAQTMPLGEAAPTSAMMTSDCDHLPGAHGAAESDMGSDCGSTGGMACLMSAGQCVMTLVLAGAPSLTFSETRSHGVTPSPLSAYQSPFLDVITPPPNFFS